MSSTFAIFEVVDVKNGDTIMLPMLNAYPYPPFVWGSTTVLKFPPNYETHYHNLLGCIFQPHLDDEKSAKYESDKTYWKLDTIEFHAPDYMARFVKASPLDVIEYASGTPHVKAD